MKIVVFAVLLFVGTVSCMSSSKKEVVASECGDFLLLADRSGHTSHEVLPRKIIFKGCEAGRLHQLRAQIARYEVSVRNAKVIETEFVNTFKMAPLRFACCGWESPRNGSFHDSQDNQYEVQMSSGETTEKNWPKIQTFHVTVYKLLELP